MTRQNFLQPNMMVTQINLTNQILQIRPNQKSFFIKNVPTQITHEHTNKKNHTNKNHNTINSLFYFPCHPKHKRKIHNPKLSTSSNRYNWKTVSGKLKLKKWSSILSTPFFQPKKIRGNFLPQPKIHDQKFRQKNSTAKKSPKIFPPFFFKPKINHQKKNPKKSSGKKIKPNFSWQK